MPTALIVEDEPDANELLGLLVQTRGYRTESVFRGADALPAVRRHAPDVVLLDLMLPDLNGFQICRAIKDDRDTTRIPVVIVTARLTADCEIESYASGANAFIRKPYSAPTLFGALDDARRWRRAALEGPGSGEFPLGADAPSHPLREIAGLASLLIARAPFEAAEARRVAEDLGLIHGFLAWADEHRGAGRALLSYAVEPDGLVVRIEDQSGWLDEFARSPAYQALVQRGHFDAVTLRPAEGRLDLLRRPAGAA